MEPGMGEEFSGGSREGLFDAFTYCYIDLGMQDKASVNRCSEVCWRNCQ